MKIKWPILLIVMMFFSCVWLDDKLSDEPLKKNMRIQFREKSLKNILQLIWKKLKKD